MDKFLTAGKLCLLLFCLLTATSCEKDEPRTPAGNSPACELVAVQYDILGDLFIDSIFYENGKVARRQSWLASSPGPTMNYVYFGQDSLHIIYENDIHARYHFDASGRIILADAYGSIATYVYNTAGDTVYMFRNNSYNRVGYIDARGNLTSITHTYEGKLYETRLTYDNNPYFAKGLYYNNYSGEEISKNNVLNINAYEDGILLLSTDYTLSYTPSGQVSRLVNPGDNYEFKYRCP